MYDRKYTYRYIMGCVCTKLSSPNGLFIFFKNVVEIVNVRVWNVSILKRISKWINQMTGKKSGYLTSTFSSQNFQCNTKLVMDAQNWTTRLAYTNILQISVHLVAKKTKLHYNNNKKGFSNLIKNISSFKMCSCRYFRNNGLHQIP